MIHLIDFPMPPPDNNLFATSFKTRRRFPSKDYKAFQHLASTWELANRNQLRAIVKDLKAPLSVHFDLFFERSKIYCKDGRTKKMDAANRLKALSDSLSKMIGIDDSEFFEVSVKKQEGPRTFVCIQIDSLSESSF